MYIPTHYLSHDQEDTIAFMKQFSFATIVTAKENVPTATHLPFIVQMEEDKLLLRSHFAKANPQWKEIEDHSCLVIFTQPNAYISPKHYEKELNVPTWNYISVHAYGRGKVYTDESHSFDLMNHMIEKFDPSYKDQWEKLPESYKQKMLKGTVPFEVEVTDLQAKKKLSQNKTDLEQEKIAHALFQSEKEHENQLGVFMMQNIKAFKAGKE